MLAGLLVSFNRTIENRYYMKYRILSVVGVLIFSFAFSSTAEINNTKDSEITPKESTNLEITKTFEEKVGSEKN